MLIFPDGFHGPFQERLEGVVPIIDQDVSDDAGRSGFGVVSVLVVDHVEQETKRVSAMIRPFSR